MSKSLLLLKCFLQIMYRHLKITTELIKQFKQLDKMLEDEKKSILKVPNALIRDFNARRPMCYK
jgi:hypothetical protein